MKNVGANSRPATAAMDRTKALDMGALTLTDSPPWPRSPSPTSTSCRWVVRVQRRAIGAACAVGTRCP
eukprot:339913-Prymnesium_polylepis.1